jgi:hypothetical protein
MRGGLLGLGHSWVANPKDSVAAHTLALDSTGRRDIAAPQASRLRDLSRRAGKWAYNLREDAFDALAEEAFKCEMSKGNVLSILGACLGMILLATTLQSAWI